MSNYGLYVIINNVKEQLYSIIANWKDIKFRKYLFITVSEESYFYEPIVDNNVRSLVVLGIRNILLETICRIEYKTDGLKSSISNEQIKEVTREVINYFNNIDLDRLSEEIVIEGDYYREISNKYPVAFNALMLE